MVETRVLRSRACDKDYQIKIALPSSYEVEPSRRYPSLYVLDSNLFFDMVLSVVRLLIVDRVLPEPLVIGVGYPFDDMFGKEYPANLLEFSKRRVVDFTPQQDEALEKAVSADWQAGAPIISGTGGGRRFWEFLSAELIPEIESRYRAIPDKRVLVGHSLSGFYVLFAVFQSPQVFQAYVAGSPAFGTGDRYLFAREAEYASQHKSLQSRVFVGIGGNEQDVGDDPVDCSVSELYRFHAIISSRKYGGLEFSKRVFEGENHISVPSMVFSWGLRETLLPWCG